MCDHDDVCFCSQTLWPPSLPRDQNCGAVTTLHFSIMKLQPELCILALCTVILGHTVVKSFHAWILPQDSTVANRIWYKCTVQFQFSFLRVHTLR
jgi:hypothetical protein